MVYIFKWAAIEHAFFAVNRFVSHCSIIALTTVFFIFGFCGPAYSTEPVIASHILEVVSDYSWGYKSGIKQPLGSYKNGISIHAISRLAPEAGGQNASDLGNPDFLVWVNEHTGEASAIEHPTGSFNNGVNPGGNAVFTSAAPSDENGRIWWVLGGRAHQLPFDLARSSGLFDPYAFDVVLDNFEVDNGSTSPVLSVVGNTGLVAYRKLASVNVNGSVRVQKYNLESGAPLLEFDKTIGSAIKTQQYGDITIEQVWSRWDPRHRALAVTWHWFDRENVGQQVKNYFGSNPFLYTDDFGLSWRLADGSIAQLPITYSNTNPILTPYDHILLRENTGWSSRDVGFSPNGTPYVTMLVGNNLAEARFFFWGGSGWESRVLTNNLNWGDPLACGASRDYLVCAYSERSATNKLWVRVSRDDGRSWSTPVSVDTLNKSNDNSTQSINWVSFVQPADRYLDNHVRFIYSYSKGSDGQTGKNYKNNIRWIRLHIGPRADFNGDQIVDSNDRRAFISAYESSDWEADFNDDGVVDVYDYLGYLTAYIDDRESQQNPCQ